MQLEPDAQRASVIRATTDSPMSPPPLTSITPSSTSTSVMSRSTTNRSSNGGIYSTQSKSLYDMLSQEKVKSRPDFSGRNPEHNVTKLYQNLVIESDRSTRGENMEVE